MMLVGTAAGGMLLASPADAAPDGGSVNGVVQLNADMKREPPIRSQGFVKRARNPILPVRSVDPFPYLVVVLDEGQADPADKLPAGEVAVLELIGESFSPPLLATVVKSEVKILNSGKNSPQLYSPQQPDLLSPEPINPGGFRPVKLNTANQGLEIRDQDSSHISGYLVAFPHRYFSRVDAGGKYNIDGVPAGRWTIRVWYRDGWLPLKGLTVDIEAKRPATARPITLPASLAVERGGAGE